MAIKTKSDRGPAGTLTVDDLTRAIKDSGILTTEREETTLYDGREWRIHYWMFRKERIAELVEAQKAKEEAEKMGSIYDDIPEDSWATATRREKPASP